LSVAKPTVTTAAGATPRSDFETPVSHTLAFSLASAFRAPALSRDTRVPPPAAFRLTVVFRRPFYSLLGPRSRHSWISQIATLPPMCANTPTPLPWLPRLSSGLLLRL